MRYTGPKNRIARREGIDLGLKTLGSKSHARLMKKLTVLPGQHGTPKRRKLSEHSFQLKEKQKLRYMFGVNAKQLKKYFDTAVVKKGNTAFYLAQFLEKRLDNVVYRLGFAPTRAAARQLVTHGHMSINGKKVSIPSYQVKTGDVVSYLKEKTYKIPYIEKSLAEKDAFIPAWLEKKAITGKVKGDPSDEDISKQINLRLVIEFYSR